jgi:arylsulfatase A-like enzyme
MWPLPFSAASGAPLYTDVVSELTADPPNVLIILADDFGTDNVAVYGEAPDAPRTPNLDALAGQGVRFRNAYGYPICSPTRAALLTGRLARRTGMGAIVEWNDTFELPLEEVTIAEFLDSGPYDYATTAIGKWHLSGPDTPNAFRHPNLQGFDHYAGPIHNLYFEDDSQKEKRDGQRSDYYSFDRVVDGELGRSSTYATHQQTDDALDAIRTMPEPWFLYVAYNAVHSPFQPPPDAGLPPNAPVPVKYDAMVRDLDTQIGRLLAGLEGKRQRTIVVFLGDNGTPKEAITPPFDPKRGKTTIYEGGTNVPLIVAGPGVTARGASADALVHVVDVLPTLARLTGLDPRNVGARLDGVSFAEVLREPTSPGGRKFVYTERMSPAGPPPWTGQWSAVRDERYKLVKSPDGEIRFFDLQGRNDDGPARERSELPDDERARFDALLAELERAVEKTPYGR